MSKRVYVPETTTSACRSLTAGPLLLVILLTVSCGGLNQVIRSGPTPPPTGQAGSAVETRTPTAEPTQPPATPTPDTVTLTLWMTEALGPVGQTAGSRQLSAQIAAFEAANPAVMVDVVLKKPYGKGGMLDYLTTTAAAVPSVLPDVAILDIRELRVANQRELVQPLDGRITPALAQDLVAPARVAGQVNGKWVGLPFEADIQHLIYNTELVPTAPITWTQVLSETAQYLFPAGGQGAVVGEGNSANDSFIIQYFGTGARLTGEDGRPALDQDAVTAVLQFYADGLAAGVIPQEAIEYAALDETWPIYLDEQVGMTNASAHRYIQNRAGFQKSSFAPIPTRDGTVTSLFKGWAYVLVAREPQRQDVAWSLIEWLTSPDRLGEWALAANHLPTRLSALPENSEDEYLNFLVELLQNARVRPTDSGYDDVGRALQRAVQAVFTGSATPAEAAAQAATSVP